MKKKIVIAKAFLASVGFCVLLASFATQGAFAADASESKYNDKITTVGAVEKTSHNGDLILKFTSSGSFTLPGPAQARILAIGGGGAGGNNNTKGKRYYGAGGGGGAGGFVELDSIGLVDGTYQVIVGTGGAAVSSVSAPTSGEDGKPSLIQFGTTEIIRADGGGGGGAESDGRSGASGGGASTLRDKTSMGIEKFGGTGIAEQGFAGGDADAKANRIGAGGGGAGGGGGRATSGTTPGAGGDGKTSIITGETVWYAGGGGGGNNNSGGTGGAGGTGGGGVGAMGGTDGDGKDGFGGGGGGDGVSIMAGKGGDGVVIVRISALLDGPLEKPAAVGYIYTGEEIVHYSAFDGVYVIDGVSQATDVGDYTMTVTPQEGYFWGSDTTDIAPVTVTWHITQAPNAIRNLTIKNWKAGGTASEPSCEADFGLETVHYTYFDVEGNELSGKPDSAGIYQVKATIAGTANYASAESGLVPFRIRDPEHSPIDGLAYFAVGEVDDLNEAGGFVSLIIGISEGKLNNFHPWQSDKGRDFRFCDEYSGEVYSSVLVSWTDEGESVFRVRLPVLDDGTVRFAVCWGELDGKTLPDVPGGVAVSGSAATVTFLETGEETDGRLKNHWFKEPSLPAAWDVGVTPVYLPGVDALNRTSTVVFVERMTHEATDVLPRAPGSYTATFTIDETERITALETVTIDFTIKPNRWVVVPRLSQTTWREGEVAANVADFGQDLRGEAGTLEIFNAITGDSFGTTFPTEAGVYEAVFSVSSGEGNIFTLADYVIPFTILGVPADMKGLTAESGRIMTAGNDKGGEPNVENMHYTTGFWRHSGSASKQDNLLASENHVFYTDSSKTIPIWELRNIRIGNTMPISTTQTGTTGFLAAQVYLPWSTPIQVNSKRSGTATRVDVAQLVMRNTTEACVYSSCFTNGIGTIYFDAANGWTSTDGGAGYQIVVEIATNCVGSTAMPTDENIQTNDFARADWKRVQAFALKRDYSPDAYASGACPFVPEGPASPTALAITNGGTTNNFYRLYVPLEIREPVRFRIRRVSVDGNFRSDIDNGGYILLDNIIVSYPAQRVDLETYGFMDEAKSGKQVLGQETAFVTPFPSAEETNILARARVIPHTNPGWTGDTTKFVTAAKMHYRWRYLDQKFYRNGQFTTTDDGALDSGWSSVWLNPSADGSTLTALKALDHPGLPGDVEYWFEATVNAPFYRYVDYSGTGLGLGGFYSEQVTSVTNRRARTASRFISKGTDWFVRLREGASDFEAVRLVLEDKPDDPVSFELVGNHIWRGYLKTPEKTSYRYRIEFLNEQTPGATEWVTNTAVFVTADVETYPVSTILDEGTEDSWAALPVDAATGYLLFQVDDKTKSITIIRADYMNFNGWTDAQGDQFVGSVVVTNDVVTSLEGVAGVSANARDVYETFDTWRDMASTNANWKESFDLGGTTLDDDPFTPFDKAISPQGWEVGPGQWVYSYYKDEESGLALQMEGQGYGYAIFDKVSPMPRGIESIQFNAYLAQPVDFDDFCYYDGPDGATLSNYTFTTRVAFDLDGATKFRGNASLSLVAYYRKGFGAYEVRLEPCKRSTTNTWDYADANGTSLSLYKWYFDEGECEMKSVCLGTYLFDITKNGSFPWGTKEDGLTTFLPMYISVTNDAVGSAYIVAGVKRGGVRWDVNVTEDSYQNNYCAVQYVDKGKYGPVLQSGRYGLLSANCEGVFLLPYLSSTTQADNNLLGGKPGENEFKGNMNTGRVLVFNDTPNSCYSGISTNYVESVWTANRRRMTAFKGALEEKTQTALFGFQAVKPQQTLTVSTRPRDGDTAQKWTKLETREVGVGTPFGSTEPYVISLYTNVNCAVRFSVDGKRKDGSCDVVIDDIEIKQWRGADWEDADTQASVGSAWRGDVSNDDSMRWGFTNFVFQSGWVTNQSVLLSAKRTATNELCAIRSPLFDGMYVRGSGLGMISYSYENAHTNACLYIQIATNVTYNNVTSINGLRSYSDGTWITVATNDLSKLTDDERRVGGVFSHYVGLHGVKGLMRIVMDPQVVTAAVASDNPQYGEILIKDVYCRDEPLINNKAWWGWNLRTVNSDGFLYLPDYSPNSSATPGLSLALNNSITDQVKPVTDGDGNPSRVLYGQHLPFVQTPLFGTNIVGEVSFKARKYDTATAQPAQVTVFGSRTGTEWTRLTATGADTLNGVFIISNDTYKTYSFKTSTKEGNYSAFRLAVTGVTGVSDAEMGNRPPESEGYDTPVRVLLDEIVVSEAVRARIGFRRVGTIRGYPPSSLNDIKEVPNLPNPNEQPLCGEGWGVQCELYAAQLPDEIDFSREPHVWLHWFTGLSPWGFENWKTNSTAHRVLLERATDTTNLVYRSTYYLNNGASIVPAVAKSSRLSDNVVQYMLEVQYYQVGQADPVTQYMAVADWERPSWYNPVDFNQDYGRNGSFAAFNILDTVAPHWAWINEVNIFDEFDDDYRNLGANNQYLELAVPAEADITGWSVNFISPKEAQKIVVTNCVAIFGEDGLSGTKANNEGMISNTVFRLLTSPQTRTSHPNGFDLPPCAQYAGTAKATIDGVWTVQKKTDDLSVNGEIDPGNPIGIQLVRASGIIEHEVVALGCNLWNDPDLELSDEDRKAHDPQNIVDFLNRTMKGSGFLLAGEDNVAPTTSLSVIDSRGETTNVWDAARLLTPGRLNEGQSIDPNHPTANGESMIIFCNLDQSGGPIVQTVADAVNTNGSQLVFIQKGHSTNITYRVAAWHELGEVTTNAVPLAAARADGATENGVFAPSIWTVSVGGPAVSNNVTVTASAQVRPDIAAQVSDARFLPAVVDWLTRRRNLRGIAFANDSDELKPADFVPYSQYATYCADPSAWTGEPLSLLDMYWLDMDPTDGTLALVAGTTRVQPEEGNSILRSVEPTPPNIKLDVFMMITNRTTGQAYAPYAIRDMAPGVSSLNFVSDMMTKWTSATFKVTGIRLNELGNNKNGRAVHLPVRWFVFTEDSFDPDTFSANIEVDNPRTPTSPGYWNGWKDALPTDTFGWGWAFDVRRQPYPVEPLRPTNDLD